MATYFNLNDKFEMILDNQGRLVLSDESILSPHNEPERSHGFVLEETLPALSRSSSNSTFDSGNSETTIGISLQCTSKEFARETFLTELRKFPSIWCKKHPDYKQRNVKVNAWKKLAATFNKDGTFLFKIIFN